MTAETFTKAWSQTDNKPFSFCGRDTAVSFRRWTVETHSTARNTANLRGLMSRGIVIWVMPIPFNVGHCRGITERFKSQIQHNSNYVVFSDSGKSLVTSPLLEVWARTRQRNICAEIPVSRSITARSERVQRHNAQSDGGQSTDTVSERVPTGQRTAREQREIQLKRWQSGEKFFLSGRKIFKNRSETGRGS